MYFQSVASIGPDLSVARKLFNEMDLNEDGTVSSSEVVDFIVRKGKMEREKARRIYLNIDMMENANHTLEDVAALWYVWLMRPRCNGCEALIMGSYYSCVDCFRSRNFSHQHGNFLDNYVLLYQKNQQQVIYPHHIYILLVIFHVRNYQYGSTCVPTFRNINSTGDSLAEFEIKKT